MTKLRARRVIRWILVVSLVVLFIALQTHEGTATFFQRLFLGTGVFKPGTFIEIDSRTPFDYSLKLHDLRGLSLDLNSHKESVIFLNFWATWCPPCRAEMPDIVRLYNDFNDTDLRFVLVSLDNNVETIESYLKKSGYDVPVYRPHGSIPESYGTSTIPVTMVIDRSGRIAFRHEGMAAYNTREFRNALREELDTF